MNKSSSYKAKTVGYVLLTKYVQAIVNGDDDETFGGEIFRRIVARVADGEHFTFHKYNNRIGLEVHR